MAMRIRRVFLKRKQKVLAPFGDHISDSFVLQKTLAEWQAAAIADIGYVAAYIQSPDEIWREYYPCLVIEEDLFFHSHTLREFIRVSELSGGSTRMVVSGGTPYFKECAPHQEGEEAGLVKYQVYYLAQSGDQPQEIVVDVGEHYIPVTLPAHIQGLSQALFPQILRPILQIRHPLHLLWANILAVNVRFAELEFLLAAKLKLLLKSHSTAQSRVLAAMNKIGQGCQIHPTACLEGVELGNDVKIGAHAVVRMSSIGDGCDIGDGAVIRHSVMGEGTVVFDNLNLNFAVTYPEVFLIHGPYNLSVFGKQSALFATILSDFRLDGKPIRIEIDNQFLPCSCPFIGSFIGHRTRVAGGSIIAPGRLIPNDLLIFPSTASTLTVIDTNLPTAVPLTIEKGKLEPIATQNYKIDM